MPRRTRNTGGRRITPVDLEQHMTLLGWLQSQLGYDNTVELLADIKQSDEGFDDEGHSYICARLITRASQMRELTADDLVRYDDNIRKHLAAMNESRQEPITLRYFQYLAALCAEIFLDRRRQSPASLLASLNAFTDDLNSHSASIDFEEQFAESDLNKLAFWMATGSGKTLLMHLNYRQFLHYYPEPLDRILLITPDEGLSVQHIEDMRESGISATRVEKNESGMLTTEMDAVSVIEITKLKTEWSGRGDSIPIEAFEGNNLLFVDEAHKGFGGEKGEDDEANWLARRRVLGKDGFTFEYSATFGQALAAARSDELTAEYGKAIAFDYSYRHFYNDGYGKDFRILNLLEETTTEQTDRLLLGNMLSFYEQRLAYHGQAHEFRPYNIEAPLWVFVGSSVNAVRTENRQPQSDVLTVARFLHRFLSEPSWAIQSLNALMTGRSNLRDEAGRDIFADRFAYLRGRGMSDSEIYANILVTVLHAQGSGALHLCDIRGSDGEIGLKASNAEDYFGLIYIGDKSKFRRLVQDSVSEIVVEDDAFSSSAVQKHQRAGYDD